MGSSINMSININFKVIRDTITNLKQKDKDEKD